MMGQKGLQRRDSTELEELNIIYTPPGTPDPTSSSVVEDLNNINVACVNDMHDIFSTYHSTLEAQHEQNTSDWESSIDRAMEEAKAEALRCIEAAGERAKQRIAQLPEEVRREAASWFTSGMDLVTRFFRRLVTAILQVSEAIRTAIKSVFQDVAVRVARWATFMVSRLLNRRRYIEEHSLKLLKA